MIHIVARLKPFSHLPGTRVLIPTTSWYAECYPTLIRVKTISGELVHEEALDYAGPLRQFTVMQDLERGCVTVFSEAYKVHILPDGSVVYKKNPSLPPLALQERLSLGCHKKQEWEQIRKRRDFREIFPLWLRLGTLLNIPARQSSGGIFSLLEQIKEQVAAHRPEEILPAFEKLFLAAFGNMLIPRVFDEQYQGIVDPSLGCSQENPLHILCEGAGIIRSLFISVRENSISLLPHLPPQFSEGRMTGLTCQENGMLDLEWSKKSLRKVAFQAKKDAELLFLFPPPLRQFRLRRTFREKGTLIRCGDSLEIKSGTLYLLDQFQK